ALCTNIITDEFIPLISSTRICGHIQEIMISADEHISYCMVCKPAVGYKKRNYTPVNPEMQQYYESRNIVYETIPDHNPHCERIFRAGLPISTAPAADNQYYISKSNPEPLLLKASVEFDVGKVFWYINDRFY